MHIFLDLDGVMADFVGALCTLYEVPNPFQYKENLGKYRVTDMIPNFKWSHLHRGFWATIPKMPEADEIINTLRYYGDVTFLTSPGHMPESAAGKMDWCFREYPKVPIILTREKHLLAQKNTLLVDDYARNVLKFEKHGGKAILLPRPWNRSFDLDTMTEFHSCLSL